MSTILDSQAVDLLARARRVLLAFSRVYATAYDAYTETPTEEKRVALADAAGDLEKAADALAGAKAVRR